ncbi:unnamed protein product [Mytilus edulis]|uniref:Uncharacterized protein n=1 Tax=Mytilus edulis TaxID=6550 RepID=A0A8S3PZL7_MYTED|nr:unnamed protein product [Mytilus edulis]
MEWAMTFLPALLRGKQADFFGKNARAGMLQLPFSKLKMDHFQEVSKIAFHVLCDHIVDNIDEYIGYLTNTHCCHSFEYDIACIDFRTEIEKLRQEGNWTSQAGDLLPLALSNWSGQPVKFFSSLTTRPITTITPSLMLMDANPIFLSYIMSENGSLPEHYDGCMKIGTAGSLTADDKEKSSLAQNDINHNQETNFSVSAILQTTNDSINRPACSHIESDIAVDVELEESLLEELFESQHNISNMEEDVSDFNCSLNQLEHTTPSKQTPKRGRRKGTPLKKKATYMTPPKKKLYRKRKAMRNGKRTNDNDVDYLELNILHKEEKLFQQEQSNQLIAPAASTNATSK